MVIEGIDGRIEVNDVPARKHVSRKPATELEASKATANEIKKSRACLDSSVPLRNEWA
jgi:hypothetical protein